MIPYWTLIRERSARCGSLSTAAPLHAAAFVIRVIWIDAEWAIIEPMIPARHGGRKRSVNVREVLNGIFYVLWTGCQWKALPKDLPPRSTVHDYLELWNWDGTLERIHHALYVELRERDGREASPTTAIIDSQSAKGAQKGGLCSILQATTRARRSRGASGTSWSTRSVSC